RAEFEQFKRHMEQKTDEMKAIRVDVHNVDVEAIKQELHTVSNTWLETLQEHYTDHTARFDKIETILNGHAKFFEEHGKRLASMATKDDLTAMQGQLKQDSDTIETRLDRMEATQEQILKLLQQKSGE